MGMREYVATSDLADGAAVYLAAFRKSIRPEPALSVAEWADRYRVLSSVSSSEYGRWRTDRTPYLEEIMDELSVTSFVKDVIFMKGSQVGGTEAGNNWIGSIIDRTPGPVLYINPTSALSKRVSKQRLAPMIAETPALAAKVRESRSRDSGNTLLVKEFPGGLLILGGANSPAELRGAPIRFLFLDEVDEYPGDLDGQGDAMDLAIRRTSNFPRAKRFTVSTPTVKGLSKIEKAWERSDQRRYHVPCPHCSHEQWLRWEQIRWQTRRTREWLCTACGAVTDGTQVGVDRHACPACHAIAPVTEAQLLERETGELMRVWYECEGCREEIGEHYKTEMLARGRWIAMAPGPNKAAGFHLSALYSPLGWYSWFEAVQYYLETVNDEDRRKVFVNTVLGDPFTNDLQPPDERALENRAVGYRLGEVPAGGLVLVAGVDVQDNRIEIKIKAFGDGEESWLVDWIQIYGDPAQQDVWLQLDEIRTHRYRHASGATLPIIAMAIDTGGHYTHAVYEYCRHRKHVIAVKGEHRAGRPVLGRPSLQDVKFNGQVIKDGVRLWPIGTDTAKSLIYARLKIETPGPRYMHFPLGLPPDYFQQLTAESMVQVHRRGYKKVVWQKDKSRRNEALDCEVYAYAAALYAGLARTNWAALREKLELDAKVLAEGGSVSRATPRRRGHTIRGRLR